MEEKKNTVKSRSENELLKTLGFTLLVLDSLEPNSTLLTWLPCFVRVCACSHTHGGFSLCDSCGRYGGAILLNAVCWQSLMLRPECEGTCTAQSVVHNASLLNISAHACSQHAVCTRVLRVWKKGECKHYKWNSPVCQWAVLLLIL